MLQLIDHGSRPGLLVSVRDAGEALAALSGGAQVIDVKEPNRGSLGAADGQTIANVISAVESRAPVTAAAGELVELIDSPHQPLPQGLSLFKIGLAGCGALPDWQSLWAKTITALWPGGDATKHAVAVAYADWQSANAPEPADVLRAALDVGCPALLIDTWDKSAGDLFDHWPQTGLARFIESARSQNVLLVLAGSLVSESFAAAVGLGPDLVAVRTAACDSGRSGAVSRHRVASLRNSIDTARSAPSLATNIKK